ncbi:ATP-binding protein [Mastigocladopsis repens]|uniref:ATP-binding protein n=1 Tax=Mastigocladopsis repens TaxID=221287 RepID=UPI0002DBBEA5|nr:ATP-binding protein [Mastigocladopsis repens]
MSTTILTLEICYEQDVVLTRQMARRIAQALGFDAQDQARLATSISEIARNAFVYANGGSVEFSVDNESPQNFWISIRDRGPGIPNLKAILDGQFTSTTGMGLGIIGTRRLMDQFQIESVANQGTTVLMGKTLPKRLPKLTTGRLHQIRDELDGREAQNPFEEIQRQNQELLRAMQELRQREEELTQLNRELEDTNRGVVALYAELDEKADSLQKANELKTRFLSNMSHEFRTPLNSIMSLSRILLDRMDGPLTTEQEKQVKFIQKGAEGLSELVNDLLDLAKVEAGKIVVYPSQFEVSDLFGTLRGMLRPLLAHNSSVALIFEEPVGIPLLYTDEGKVAQILRNFISNALKYTEQGEVRVAAVMAGNRVTFSVADTGIGIAPQDQERIFEDFVQIESHLQQRVKGTGLGLPLSRKLTELLGGSVWVNSELGKGSTFFASLPLVFPGSAEDSSIPQPTWQIDPARHPILVVEDNAETVFAYEKYFQESKYQMISARTLNEAKQALMMFKPIAIMLDILLGKEHSWAFLAETKRNEATRNIPILVISVVDNEKQVMAQGADGFLIKPVDRFLLLNKISTLVKQDRQQKLLLIDDDQASRYVLKQLLVHIPLDILEAADGREGIRLAQLENPDCIVLDMTMPELSGIDVLDQLKSNRVTTSIPVIVNTSKQIESQEQKFLAEHAVAILSKETLSQEVARVLLREALKKAGLFLDT